MVVNTECIEGLTKYLFRKGMNISSANGINLLTTIIEKAEKEGKLPHQQPPVKAKKKKQQEPEKDLVEIPMQSMLC